MADRLIIKCERHWNRQKMKKQIEKRDRERKLQSFHEGATSTSIDMMEAVIAQTSPNQMTTGVLSGEDRGYGSNGPITRGATAVSAPNGQTAPRRHPAGGGRGGPNPGRGKNPGRGANPGRRQRTKGTPNVENPGRGQPVRSRLCNSATTKEATATKTPSAPTQKKAANEDPPPQETRSSPVNIGDTSYQDDDICLGNENHIGTKEFRRAVQKSVKKFIDQDYGPEIYKSVKKQLKGRRFFEEAVPGTWVELSKSERIDEVAKAFNAESMRAMSK